MPKLNTTDTGVEIKMDDGASSFAQYATKDLGENFAYLQNPNDPSKTIAIGKGALTGDGSLGQMLSDLGGYVPVGRDVFNPAPAAAAGTSADTGGFDINSFIDNELDMGSPDITSSLTFGNDADYRGQINKAAENARAMEEQRQIAAKEQMRAEIGAAFDPKIEELVEFQGEQEDASRGRFGLNRRLSTAGEAYVGEQKSRIQKQINYLEGQKALAIRNMDATLANQMDSVIKEAKAQEMQLIQLEMTAENNKLNQLSTLLNIKTQVQNQPLDYAAKYLDVISNIPAGETMEIGGMTFKGIGASEVEPFWTSSAIVSLAKAIPVGETRTVYDPSLGEIEIEGLMSDDPSIKMIQSTNDAGEVFLTKYDSNTGDVLGQTSLGKIGKTKTQASNVTLNMNDAQKSDLAAALNVLEATKGEKYNSAEVAKQYRIYNQAHPGKGDQLLEAIKAEVNYDDQVIKELYDRKEENTGQMDITLPSGAQISF